MKKQNFPGVAPGAGYPRDPYSAGRATTADSGTDRSNYKELSASRLLCPKCKQATQVRERLLLVLPDGDLFDYVCTVCGSSAGTKKGS